MLFLMLAGIGLTLLLVSAVFDGLLDLFDLDTPFLSGTAPGGAAVGMRAMQNSKTDAKISPVNVVWSTGTVVIPIRAGSCGEVAVTVTQSLSSSAVKAAPLT